MESERFWKFIFIGLGGVIFTTIFYLIVTMITYLLFNSNPELKKKIYSLMKELEEKLEPNLVGLVTTVANRFRPKN